MIFLVNLPDDSPSPGLQPHQTGALQMNHPDLFEMLLRVAYTYSIFPLT